MFLPVCIDYVVPALFWLGQNVPANVRMLERSPNGVRSADQGQLPPVIANDCSPPKNCAQTTI